MTDKEKLDKLFEEQKYMVLGVTLPDGTPWAVPVRVLLQWQNVFEWDSREDTEHSKVIAKNPRIALTIFDGAPDAQVGFYAIAEAEIAESHGDGTARYRAIVEKAWINDETYQKREVNLL